MSSIVKATYRTAKLTKVVISVDTSNPKGESMVEVLIPSSGVEVERKAHAFHTRDVYQVTSAEATSLEICAKYEDFKPTSTDGWSKIIPYDDRLTTFESIKRIFWFMARTEWPATDLKYQLFVLPHPFTFSYKYKSRLARCKVCEVIGFAKGESKTRSKIAKYYIDILQERLRRLEAARKAWERKRAAKEAQARAKAEAEARANAQESSQQTGGGSSRSKPSGANTSSALVKYPNREHYEVLGLSKGASLDQIKTAYRKQAMKYHTDKIVLKDGESNESFQRRYDAAQDMMQKINQANDVLAKGIK